MATLLAQGGRERVLTVQAFSAVTNFPRCGRIFRLWPTPKLWRGWGIMVIGGVVNGCGFIQTHKNSCYFQCTNTPGWFWNKQNSLRTQTSQNASKTEKKNKLLYGTNIPGDCVHWPHGNRQTRVWSAKPHREEPKLATYTRATMATHTHIFTCLPHDRICRPRTLWSAWAAHSEPHTTCSPVHTSTHVSSCIY